jgi:hypothetical protein
LPPIEKFQDFSSETCNQELEGCDGDSAGADYTPS